MEGQGCQGGSRRGRRQVEGWQEGPQEADRLPALRPRDHAHHQGRRRHRAQGTPWPHRQVVEGSLCSSAGRVQGEGRSPGLSTYPPPLYIVNTKRLRAPKKVKKQKNKKNCKYFVW